MSTPKTEKLSLAAKLADILGSVGQIKKKGRNAHFNYEFFSESQLMAEFRAKVASHNIIILPSVDSIAHTQIGKEGKEQQLVTVTTSYRIIDGDSNETFELKGAGMGTDAGDKGVYKAITGAMKYMLMKLFFVSDGQDPENDGGGSNRGRGESTGTAGRHSPTRPYEQERGSNGDSDLQLVRQWLKASGITEEFLMACCVEAKIAEPTQKLDDLQPGVLVRILKPKAQEKVQVKWNALQEKSGAAAERTAGAGGGENAPSGSGSRSRKQPSREETRTNEGDQRRGIRQPCQTDLPPEEVLEQEGIESWQDVKVHWGNDKGTRLGDLKPSSLTGYWISKWVPKPYKGKLSDEDILLDAALCVASKELAE